jgi:hypothetical protein
VKESQKQVDLCVIGGGLAGTCAAIAAARNGIRVALVQDRSVLGGNASSEIKMHVVGADVHGTRPGAREAGIIEELRLEDAYRNPQRCYSLWDLLLYEKVMAEPNIELLLDTDCVGCEKDKDRIVSANCHRQSTEETIRIEARFFADCSGDGRLAAEAGADYTIGRESKAEYGEPLAQDIPDRFTLGSSILYTARDHGRPMPFHAPEWIRRFTKDDFYMRETKSYEYGMWWCEWGGHLDTIGDNPAIRHELLRCALGIWDYIKNSGEHPDSASWALDWVGALPGKRESRRFLGPHVLTQADLQAGEIFPDSVAYGGWPIDLHPPMGIDATTEAPCNHVWLEALYGIPARCLFSRNVDNLFFAGRNVSATHVAFASTRVMATCAVMGQAVGTMAAVATKKGFPSARDVLPCVKTVQQTLLRDDAFLPGLRNEDPLDLARTAAVSASSTAEGFPPERVIDGITRPTPSRFGTWADDGDHAWRSVTLPATLTLTWPQPVTLQEIHLTFDSGLERPLMLSMSDHYHRRQVNGGQPEIVSRYRILAGGHPLIEVVGNHRRKRVHRLPTPVSATQLHFEAIETHGAPEARLFEVRCYARPTTQETDDKVEA